MDEEGGTTWKSRYNLVLRPPRWVDAILAALTDLKRYLGQSRTDALRLTLCGLRA